MVLLGLFNAQGLGATCEAAVRHSVVDGADGRVAVVQRPHAGGGGGGPAAPLVVTSSHAADAEVEIMLRVTPGVEYVKLVVVRGRVKGAMLIGDTDLEETVENMILNRIDVRPFGAELLNPEVDLEDFFD